MVMVTHAEVARLIKRVRELSARVKFLFKGHRYVMVINGFVRAEDKDSSKVDWQRAFGSLTPAQLLSTLPIEAIEVQTPKESLKFTNLKDFLKWIT